MTDQTTSPHRVAFTVTVTSRPDGGHYFDRDDFLAHIVQWVKAGLKGKHAIAEVTIADAPAASSCVPAATPDWPSRRTGLRQQLADATVPLLLDTLPKAIADGRGREVADAVLTVLYREWPWLRAETEDTTPMPAAATEDRCGECGHFRGAHQAAEEPVSVGYCTVCADDDAWHDFDLAEPEQRLAAPVVDPGSLRQQTTPCRTTQHCAYHGWCRRCAPHIAAVMSRINTAIQRTDTEASHWGPLYEAIAKAVAVLPGDTRTATLHEAADLAERLMDERYGPDCSYAIGGLTVAEELRRMAAETTQPAHACDNCQGIDPDTCLFNPNRPPEQCPNSEFDGYGLQCQKPAGHNLCTFEEEPAAPVQQPATEEQS